jgi:hypothetical protein
MAVKSPGDKMKRTRRMKITVEKERLLVVSQRQGTESWCEECSARVRMLRPGEAAAVANVSDRTIFRQIESRRLHFNETSDGAVLVCLNSLLKQTSADRQTVERD